MAEFRSAFMKHFGEDRPMSPQMAELKATYIALFRQHAMPADTMHTADFDRLCWQFEQATDIGMDFALLWKAPAETRESLIGTWLEAYRGLINDPAPATTDAPAPTGTPGYYLEDLEYLPASPQSLFLSEVGFRESNPEVNQLRIALLTTGAMLSEEIAELVQVMRKHKEITLQKIDAPDDFDTVDYSGDPAAMSQLEDARQKFSDLRQFFKDLDAAFLRFEECYLAEGTVAGTKYRDVIRGAQAGHPQDAFHTYLEEMRQSARSFDPEPADPEKETKGSQARQWVAALAVTAGVGTAVATANGKDEEGNKKGWGFKQVAFVGLGIAVAAAALLIKVNKGQGGGPAR